MVLRPKGTVDSIYSHKPWIIAHRERCITSIALFFTNTG